MNKNDKKLKFNVDENFKDNLILDESYKKENSEWDFLREKNDKINELYEKLVCDSNLKEKIKKYRPIEVEEFNEFSEVDDEFIKRNEEILKEIGQTVYLKGKPNRNLKSLLRILGDRLLNFSKNNKMIWSNKLNYSQNIDLFTLEKESFLDLINLLNSRFVENREVKIEFSKQAIINRYSSLDDKKTSPDYEEEDEQILNLEQEEVFDKKTNVKIKEAQFNFLSSMENRNTLNKQEKGHDLLYIALGFVSGINEKISDEGIPFFAPLLLVPVSIVRDFELKESRISFDSKRDIEINPFIKFSYLKNFTYKNSKTVFENLSLILSELSLDNKFKSLNKDLIDNKFIKNDYFKKFHSVDIDDIKSKLHFKSHITLGIFNKFDNSLQQDIENIIINRSYSDVLKKTFENSDIYDYEELKQLHEEVNSKMNFEEDINYINTLNYSQFSALRKINNDKINHLVIDGPPGTGKSETILSIIIDGILKNKKIAVISEKKAAIDVIHQRLGELSNFSLMINNISDKQYFYDQLKNTMEYSSKIETFETKGTESISEKIKENLDKLDEAYKSLKIGDLKLIEIIEKWSNYSFSKNEYISYEPSIDYKVNDTESLISILSFLENFKALKFHISNLKDFKLFDSFETYDDYYEEKYKEKMGYALELSKIEEIYRKKNELLKYIEFWNILSFFNFVKKRKFKRLIGKMDEFHFIDLKSLRRMDSRKYDELFLMKIDEQRAKITNKEKELEHIYSSNPSLNFFFNLSSFEKKIFNLLMKNEEIIERKVKEIGYAIVSNFLKSQSGFEKSMEIYKNYDDILFRIDNLQKEKAKRNKMNAKTILNNTFRETFEEFSAFSKTRKRISQKRLSPLKNFMDDNSLLIKNAYKIWLMQPEVVPHFFREDEQFDIVLIDEASQMFIERSISIIQRAKKVVILGDQKQLRPSNFFNNRIAYDENQYLVESDESILDHAVSKYERVMLKTHYRSKYFELIDFSNRHFYDGKLLSVSSPSDFGNVPIEFHQLDTRDYKSGENKYEAKKVIGKLEELVFDDMNIGKTIGIVSMNRKQNDLLNALIEDKVNISSKFRDRLENVKIFTKNIENVQGDEADIIIFSNTYGPNTDGRQNYNFGPINQRFGENRVNVAITRAKERMIIFNSILIEGVNLNKSTSIGFKTFIEFIMYAQKTARNYSGINIEYDQTNKYTTSIERKIYESLKDYLDKNNLKIINNYEFSGYKLNLLILDEFGKPLLGIEVDDSNYHFSKFARERDLSRNQYLISKGWTIHKIWSGNWFNSSDFETRKVLIKLDAIINGPKKFDSEISDEITLENELRTSEFTSEFEMKEIKEKGLSDTKAIEEIEEFVKEISKDEK